MLFIVPFRIDIQLRFEKAYSLYRLNKTQEALNILNAIDEPTQHEKELKAQVVRRIFILNRTIYHIIKMELRQKDKKGTNYVDVYYFN